MYLQYVYTATAGQPTPPPHSTDCTPHYCTSLIFPLSSTSIDLVSEKGSSKVGLGRERGRKFCSLRLVDRDMWTVRAFALPGDTTDGVVVTVEPTAAPLPVPPEGTEKLSSSVAIVYCWWVLVLRNSFLMFTYAHVQYMIHTYAHACTQWCMRTTVSTYIPVNSIAYTMYVRTYCSCTYVLHTYTCIHACMYVHMYIHN